MKAEPQVLYHYTSLDTLALILTNKSICFNTLLNVDDIDEAETSDLGQFGKYVYVSCWTDEAAESIAMWAALYAQYARCKNPVASVSLQKTPL